MAINNVMPTIEIIISIAPLFPNLSYRYLIIAIGIYDSATLTTKPFILSSIKVNFVDLFIPYFSSITKVS